MKNRLVMFEGIPGSGKTISAQLLYEHFVNNKLATKVYTEGSVHPIDLPFHAYLSTSAFDDLRLAYADQADDLANRAIREEDYVLVPYKLPDPADPAHDALTDYLKSKEFCYTSTPVVPFETFKNVFYKRCERFVSGAIDSAEIVIMESVLLQHQLHDIHRLYPDVSEEEQTHHIRMLAHILEPLEPILFYISQQDVEQALIQTAQVRQKPAWSTPEKVKYYVHRKRIEMSVLADLPFATHVIDNTDRDLDKMFATIVERL